MGKIDTDAPVIKEILSSVFDVFSISAISLLTTAILLLISFAVAKYEFLLKFFIPDISLYFYVIGAHGSQGHAVTQNCAFKYCVFLIVLSMSKMYCLEKTLHKDELIFSNISILLGFSISN